MISLAFSIIAMYSAGLESRFDTVEPDDLSLVLEAHEGTTTSLEGLCMRISTTESDGRVSREGDYWRDRLQARWRESIHTKNGEFLRFQDTYVDREQGSIKRIESSNETAIDELEITLLNQSGVTGYTGPLGDSTRYLLPEKLLLFAIGFDSTDAPLSLREAAERFESTSIVKETSGEGNEVYRIELSSETVLGDERTGIIRVWLDRQQGLAITRLEREVRSSGGHLLHRGEAQVISTHSLSDGRVVPKVVEWTLVSRSMEGAESTSKVVVSTEVRDEEVSRSESAVDLGFLHPKSLLVGILDAQPQGSLENGRRIGIADGEGGYSHTIDGGIPELESYIKSQTDVDVDLSSESQADASRSSSVDMRLIPAVTFGVCLTILAFTIMRRRANRVGHNARVQS